MGLFVPQSMCTCLLYANLYMYVCLMNNLPSAVGYMDTIVKYYFQSMKDVFFSSLSPFSILPPFHTSTHTHTCLHTHTHAHTHTHTTHTHTHTHNTHTIHTHTHTIHTQYTHTHTHTKVCFLFASAKKACSSLVLSPHHHLSPGR